MKISTDTFRLTKIAAGVLFALGGSNLALAQEAEEEVAGGDEAIEEVVVLGRFISSSQQLVNERMNDAFATDLLGAETIQRLGDSTVANALRRVPGLTLVQDRFVYIRGLGERYSSTTARLFRHRISRATSFRSTSSRRRSWSRCACRNPGPRTCRRTSAAAR